MSAKTKARAALELGFQGLERALGSCDASSVHAHFLGLFVDFDAEQEREIAALREALRVMQNENAALHGRVERLIARAGVADEETIELELVLDEWDDRTEVTPEPGALPNGGG